MKGLLVFFLLGLAIYVLKPLAKGILQGLKGLFTGKGPADKG